MAMSLLRDVQAVLTDIEGTTTPISYVKFQVFPFIRENIQEYLQSQYHTEEAQSDIDSLRQFAAENAYEPIPMSSQTDGDADKETVISKALSLVNKLMDVDSKVTALKQLQGHVWSYAVKAGKQITGLDVYEDVVRALQRWKADGVPVYIFSSGSVEAQRLLFGHSSHGDLLQYFRGHFDTTVGTKLTSSSYDNIAAQINGPAERILFLTDIVGEAKAAEESGMKTCLVIREGNAPLSDEDRTLYRTIVSFDELFS